MKVIEITRDQTNTRKTKKNWRTKLEVSNIWNGTKKLATTYTLTLKWDLEYFPMLFLRLLYSISKLGKSKVQHFNYVQIRGGTMKIWVIEVNFTYINDEKAKFI